MPDNPWRDRFGRFNPRGHYKAVNGRLVKRRGIRSPSAINPTTISDEAHPDKPWRDRFGRFNPRGTYKAISGSLVKLKGFRKPHAVTDQEALDPTPSGLPPGPHERAPGARAGPSPERPDATVDERRTSRKGATYATYFRALGTFANNADVYNRDLIYSDVDEIGAPAAWYSNQGLILGQVKWRGIVALEELLDRLNLALQFAGEEIAGFDFRNVYPVWSFKYQVVEFLGPTERVIKEFQDSRG